MFCLFIANTSLVGGTITANTQLNAASANVMGLLDAGSARIATIIANTSLVGGTVTANTQLNAGSANVMGLLDAGSARIAIIVANTSLLGGTITANTQLNAGSANIVNTMNANTVNAGSISAVTHVYTNSLTSNGIANLQSANTQYISVVDTTYTKFLKANTDIYTPSINADNIFANNSIIAGKDLTVKGNFVIDGGTIYNSNEFDLYGATPITASQTARFGVNRGEKSETTFTPNAYIQFENSDKQWKIRGIHGGTAEQNTYYTIVTEKYVANTSNAGIVQLNDSNTSTSNTLAATANSINNMRLDVNAKVSSNVSSINASITANAASANSVINSRITSNVINLGTSTVIQYNLANAFQQSGLTGSDPGNGNIRFNANTANGNFTAVSRIFADNLDKNGSDVSNVFNLFGALPGEPFTYTLRISALGTSNSVIYSGTSSISTGYGILAVNYQSSTGVFSNNDVLLLNFSARGVIGCGLQSE